MPISAGLRMSRVCGRRQVSGASFGLISQPGSPRTKIWPQGPAPPA